MTTCEESRLPVVPHEAADEILTRRNARSTLLGFTRRTKADYLPSWHHHLLCDALDRFVSGECRRLIVMMPPRHGKSELVSRRLPAYLLGRNPDKSIIACSYSADLASRMNRDVQRIIDSPSYAQLFPNTQLWGRNVRMPTTGAWMRNSELFEVVNRRGSYRSAGVGQGITGMGFDWGIIDDPVKDREEADSPAYRDRVWDWYTSTFLSRQAPGAGILICMTRWNQDDLVGRLLRSSETGGDQWEVIRWPAIKRGEPTAADPRHDGEPLWPERYGLPMLETIRAASPYDFASLYEQDPRNQGSVEWPDEYFTKPGLWFDDFPDRSEWRAYIQFLDPSKGRDSKHGDYSALIHLVQDTQGKYWVEAELTRQPAEHLCEGLVASFVARQPIAVGVEANGFQELLAGIMLRIAQDRGVVLPLHTVTNNENKIVRVRRLGPILAQGLVRFRVTPGTRLLVKQLEEFPVADHDDGPDALEGAVRLMHHVLAGGQRRGTTLAQLRA